MGTASLMEGQASFENKRAVLDEVLAELGAQGDAELRPEYPSMGWNWGGAPRSQFYDVTVGAALGGLGSVTRLRDEPQRGRPQVRVYRVVRDKTQLERHARVLIRDHLFDMSIKEFWKLWGLEIEKTIRSEGIPTIDQLNQLGNAILKHHGPEISVIRSTGDHVHETPSGFLYWRWV